MSNNWKEISVGNTDTWNQEEPIEGLYVKKLENVGPNDSNQYVIETTDGEVAVWGATVLDNKFEQIEIGTEVRIEYLGKVKGKTGTQYKDYKVSVRESEEAEKVKKVFEDPSKEIEV